jgi:hypothetical protein
MYQSFPGRQVCALTMGNKAQVVLVLQQAVFVTFLLLETRRTRATFVTAFLVQVDIRLVNTLQLVGIENLVKRRDAPAVHLK